MGYDPHKYIDRLPAEAIDEFHLGGFTPEPDEADPGAEVWIDTHAASIAVSAWELYAYSIRRLGVKPTLIEWDNEIPPLATLLGEAGRADGIVGSTFTHGTHYADAR